MTRIVLIIVRSFFFLPYYITKILILRNIKKYDKETRYSFLHQQIPRVIRRGRIKLCCTGLENLPANNGYILFPNHQGLFDALAFLETHERPFSTIMKKEVEHIFLLSSIAKMLEAEFMDRSDVRQSMKVIQSMSKRVQTGDNFIIFAEGTRSKNGNNLGEFKHGSFKSAIYAKCPIVPVALIDSFQAFDSHSTKPLTVGIHYLKPLYYDDYKDMKSSEIAEYVASLIQEKINTLLVHCLDDN